MSFKSKKVIQQQLIRVIGQKTCHMQEQESCCMAVIVITWQGGNCFCISQESTYIIDFELSRWCHKCYTGAASGTVGSDFSLLLEDTLIKLQETTN